MALSLSVGNRSFELGSPGFLKAFFSTVFVRLEDGIWGRDFPVVMKELYSGHLPAARAGLALAELELIRERLGNFSPEDVVWDFEDRRAQPPWGNRISPHINSLANYFVTSDGKDFLEVLKQAFVTADRLSTDATVE